MIPECWQPFTYWPMKWTTANSRNPGLMWNLVSSYELGFRHLTCQPGTKSTSVFPRLRSGLPYNATSKSVSEGGRQSQYFTRLFFGLLTKVNEKLIAVSIPRKKTNHFPETRNNQLLLRAPHELSPAPLQQFREG